MMPTLNEMGDVVLVDKLTTKWDHIQRGTLGAILRRARCAHSHRRRLCARLLCQRCFIFAQAMLSLPHQCTERISVSASVWSLFKETW
jgi:hypothetical protein